MIRNNKVFFVALLAAVALIQSPSFSVSRLDQVRLSENGERATLVFDISGEADFTRDRVGEYIQIDILNCYFNRSIRIPDVSKSQVLSKIIIASLEGTTKAYIYLKFPSHSSIFPLYYPNRIVLDFKKDIKEFERMVIAPGLEYIRIARATEAGPVLGGVLRVNPRYFDVYPALAQKEIPEPDMWGRLAKFFMPWVEEKTYHYFRETTSSIASREGAVAAVNGTYFDTVGRPLGILMISGEVITSPIYDRTALVISKDDKPFIDNILVDSYFPKNGIILR